MPDAGFVLPPTARVVDASIAAINGGSIEFYSAGTTTPKTVYSDATLSTSLGSIVYLDSGGHPVASQGSSTKVTIYTGSATIKMVVKTSAGATVATYDNVQCAQDTSSFSTSSTGSGIAGVEAKTSDYSIVLADNGQWFDCDPTGAAFTMTLPDAATVGDRFAIGIRHAGTTTTNAVKILSVTSQTIARDATSGTADVLSGGGESVWLVSNGANWRAVTQTPPRLPYQPLPVADRLSTPPASPAAGAWYITTGTLTDAWSSWTAGDIARANGQGGWIRYQPYADCGWIAFVQDENTNYQYQNTAWVAQSGMAAGQTSTLKRMVLHDVKAQNTAGGTATSGSWQDRALNTEIVNTITGASVDTGTGIVTLPADTYLVLFASSHYNTAASRSRFKSTTTATQILSPNVLNANTAPSGGSLDVGMGVFTLASTETFKLQSRVTSSEPTDGFGLALNIASETELYSVVEIISLTSLQGPAGETGPQGSVAATPYGALTLANGANSNVVIGTNQMLRITGPSGAFSVNGFVAPTTAKVLFLYNPTAQTMTITNDATSTAANRILTMTGANVALTGPSMASFIYDTTDARWLLTATQG